MGLLDRIEEERVQECAKAFLNRMIALCREMGDGDLECDDHGDRWLIITSREDENLYAEVRATHDTLGKESMTPVWQIEIYHNSAPRAMVVNGYTEHFVERN